MPKRSKYTPNDKFCLLKMYDEGIKTAKELKDEFGVTKTTLQSWRHKFKLHGANGITEVERDNHYSQTFEEHIVSEIIAGEISINGAARKYNVPSKTTVANWVKRYNEHREIKPTPKGLNHFMTKGRATEWKERIEIALYCIAHDHNYSATAEAYGVSYNQVYQWVRKYESCGEEALKDRRGRTKTADELTPEEQIQLEIKKLKMDNERLRAENAFLKKLEELERRRS